MALQGGGGDPVAIVRGVRRRDRGQPVPSAVRVRRQRHGTRREASEVALGGRVFFLRDLLPNYRLWGPIVKQE